MARGTYHISIGLDPTDIEGLRAEGFPVSVALQEARDAPRMVTAGYGLLGLLTPHAAKLFVNWIAMKEGNETYNRAQVSASVRADVDNSGVPEYIVPKAGQEYVDTYGWEWMPPPRSPQHLERLKALPGR